MKIELEGDDHVIIGLLIVAAFASLIVWCIYSYNVKQLPASTLTIVQTNAPVALEDNQK